MRFAQLRYLEAALRTGSFRQAAKELDIAQPTIIPLPFPRAHASISAIVRKDEARTSAVQALLGLLRDSVKNLRSP
ncbi:helix-turn-helix domain-containing protein [Saccharopolyspora shandongensis]|uniref:helix-turn-helix domain-containing protein n=1 Tax=Saccharopolyspora shandongensis TaxID=418495 RepID=UPI00340E9B90